MGPYVHDYRVFVTEAGEVSMTHSAESNTADFKELEPARLDQARSARSMGCKNQL